MSASGTHPTAAASSALSFGATILTAISSGALFAAPTDARAAANALCDDAPVVTTSAVDPKFLLSSSPKPCKTNPILDFVGCLFAPLHNRNVTLRWTRRAAAGRLLAAEVSRSPSRLIHAWMQRAATKITPFPKAQGCESAPPNEAQSVAFSISSLASSSEYAPQSYTEHAPKELATYGEQL